MKYLNSDSNLLATITMYGSIQATCTEAVVAAIINKESGDLLSAPPTHPSSCSGINICKMV